MAAMGVQTDENLLVSFDTKDDAGVYKISEDQALVLTVDYITPVTDDAFLYGQVAAANSLSDVYAMGGVPLLALNLCNFPATGVPKKVLENIIRGGYEKVREAGALIVGGHTVKDEEMKYGLSVVGTVHPDRVVRNSTAKAGDVLILTKPIGTGVMITGFKRKIVSEEVMTRAVQVMAELSKTAAEAMQEVGVNAATDITGFGLAGHGLEMAEGSGVTLRFQIGAIPRFPESVELNRAGLMTGNTEPNRVLAAGKVEVRNVPDEEESLIYDPQTSGGLLISVPAKRADLLLGLLKKRGVEQAAIVGEVLPQEAVRIILER